MHTCFRCDFAFVTPSTISPTTTTVPIPSEHVCSEIWFYVAIPSLIFNGILVLGFVAILTCWKLKKITFNCFNLQVDNVNANFLGGRSETVINNEAFESFSSSSYEIEH